MNVEEFVKEVEAMSVNALTVSKELLADGKPVTELRMEHRKVMPERMESPARSHVFHSVAGFAAYLQANKTDHTLVMADLATGLITAVLDDRAATGFELIRLKPAEFPAFTMLKALLNRSMSIPTFANLVMRNRRVLCGDDEETARQLALTMQQITIASSITAAIGVGSKSVNGIMVTTEVKAGGPVSHDTVELPESLTAFVPLFIGRPIRKFDIDLTVIADTKKADIIAEAPELEVLIYEEHLVMLDEVRAEVGDEVMVGVGHIGHTDWSYNNGLQYRK
jgi:hypothetical protein